MNGGIKSPFENGMDEPITPLFSAEKKVYLQFEGERWRKGASDILNASVMVRDKEFIKKKNVMNQSIVCGLF